MDIHGYIDAAYNRFLHRDIIEAERIFRLADQAFSHNPKLTYDLGACLIMQGKYEEGFRLIARTGMSNSAWGNTTPVGQNQWHGEPLQGKSILVMTSLGYGDRIMMARYFEVLKQLGAERLGVSSSRELGRLFSAIPAVDEWHLATGEEAAPWENYDYSTRCMTLPSLCGTNSVDAVPAHIPYLKVPRDIDESGWIDKIDFSGPLRVGLVWAGNPALGSDKRRSIELEKLDPLFDQKNVLFYSLQMDHGRKQIENVLFKERIVDLMDGNSDFADTAAKMEKLDLVISVDTSSVHLAGALGKPVWMLDRFDHSHLWLLDRADSPWYPGVMRIFRQPTLGDWDSVIESVSWALGSYVKRGSAGWRREPPAAA